MKRLVILSLLFFSAIRLSAQVKVGEAISNIQVNTLLNAPGKSTSLKQLNGKVVLLEFWATWCSPCLEAMPHLKELQKAFNGKLQVLTVSTEKEKRIKQFLHNQPSNLWFSVDSADAFRKEFPYRTIPHSVLINQKGIVVAITEPENITSQVIANVISGRKISLPLKGDNMDKDAWLTHFSADTATQSHFIVQPKIDGLGSGCKNYLLESSFKNRRISMLNLSLEAAYRIAYGDLPYGRTIDLTPKENILENKKMYCIDIIVPKGQEKELLPTLQKELKSRFELQASVEKRMKHVYILTIADTDKIVKIKKSKETHEIFDASQGMFNGEGVQFKMIADYLEGFGLVNLPVVDETNNFNKYDIAFTYMPEKKGDLENTLQNMGFKLTKTDREIDMLVFK